MPASRIIRHKVEIYANTLFEFSSKAGTEAQALHALDCVAKSVSEVQTTVLVLAQMGKGDVLPGVITAYERLCKGDTALETSEAATIAKTLDEAERNEHHEARVLADLRNLVVMTPEVMGLLGVIGTGSDRRLLPQIAAKLAQIVGERGKTALVDVTTAIPLDGKLCADIVRKMQAELGRPVYVVEHVDPAIIGGLIVSVGDDIRDASVRTQLQNMREVLSKPTVGGDGK